ncbi:TPA: replication factor C small subunit [Candidatus Geothermarchaeota archaeon]|nr:replication factor C small subunit [Candidatus Geothermarchaeota archaeon]
MSALLWIEKYRPKKLDEIINQDEVVSGLKNLLSSNVAEMPHLLFAGPPGTGKTTAALAFARELYGENWRDYILELNASDERGINVIREKVKVFSQYFTPSEAVPFKLVILDEADMMTSEAQTALRRIMELNARITRFILICNYLNRIISPIQSRTAIFRFKSLSPEDVKYYLKMICKKEGLRCGDEVLTKIYEFSLGDMRRALNLLQSAATVSMGDVTIDVVENIVGKTSPELISKVIDMLRMGDFSRAKSTLYDFMSVSGIDSGEIIRLLYSELLAKNLMNAEVAEAMAEIEYRMQFSSNPEIQITALLAKLSLILSGGK